MKRLRSPKACAALVMIAWLATLVSLWGFGVAGRRAIGDDPSCSMGDLQNRGVRLELASDAGEMRDILNGDPFQAECIRRGEAGTVIFGDSFFLVCYSLLVLALFLFVRALRPSSGRALAAVGVLLALTMAAGDVVENLHLLRVIQLAGEPDPPLDAIAAQWFGLKTAAYVKMGALALATVVLGALWPSRSRWARVLQLFGFAAAALFVAAMVLDLRKEMLDIFGFQIRDWQAAVLGMTAFALFAFGALIHAAVTAADPAGEGARP